MRTTTFEINQNLIDEHIPRILVQSIHEKELSPDILDKLFAESDSPTQSVGLSAAYSSGNLNSLAVATASNVLIIQFYSSKPKREGRDNISTSHRAQPQKSASRKLLEERVLCRPTGKIVAFDLAPLALLLFSDHNLRLANGVDIQSGCSARDRLVVTSIKVAAGDVEVFEENIILFFSNLEHDPTRSRELALRAWMSYYMTQFAGMEERLEKAVKINTQSFTETVSSLFFKWVLCKLQSISRKWKCSHDLLNTG
jgi:hypothetical protein